MKFLMCFFIFSTIQPTFLSILLIIIKLVVPSNHKPVIKSFKIEIIQSCLKGVSAMLYKHLIIYTAYNVLHIMVCKNIVSRTLSFSRKMLESEIFFIFASYDL